MSVSTWSPNDIAGPLDQRAERIRSLVTTARTCIIEIGRELIAAKAEVPHGRFENWVRDEFGWAYSTAASYMQIADAFKTLPGRDLDALAIDVKALRVLSSPTVPPEVRTEAVQRAEAGEVITKKAAKLGLHKGRPKKMSDDSTFPEPVKLHELGLSRDESARLKALAETPAPILDAIIEAHKEQKVPLTSAGVTRASKAAAEASWSPADIKANPLPTAANKPASNQRRTTSDNIT